MSLYTVRTPDGELHFQSLYDVEQAFRNGLISRDDEVSEAGKPGWKKAGSMHVIASKQSTDRGFRFDRQKFLLVLVVALGIASLVLMVQSHMRWGGGLALAAAILSLQSPLFGAYRKKK